MNNSINIGILISITVLTILALFFVDPIPQDPGYHDFADQRLLLGIPNFWNVITNIPFVIVGIIGIVYTFKKLTPGNLPELRLNYNLFFFGVFLVGFGSSYYHWLPNNERLVWDRLPMTIAFMSFFSVILGEYLSIRFGKSVLFPFIIIGIVSVLYWRITEQAGQGDLRPYAVIQFLPMMLIPVIMLMCESQFESNKFIWWFMIAYLIAKITEHFDEQFLNLIFISGHSLKHLIAAAGTYFFLLALRRRVLKNT